MPRFPYQSRTQPYLDTEDPLASLGWYVQHPEPPKRLHARPHLYQSVSWIPKPPDTSGLDSLTFSKVMDLPPRTLPPKTYAYPSGHGYTPVTEATEMMGWYNQGPDRQAIRHKATPHLYQVLSLPEQALDQGRMQPSLAVRFVIRTE